MLAKAPTLLENEARSRALTERALRNPIRAQLTAGTKGAWYAVLVHPGQEGIVCAHLIARQFGLYLPQYTRDIIVKGRKRTLTRNLFPGYVFVFAWNISRNARRINSIPGTNGILSNNYKEPVVISDAMIDQVRIEENKLNPEFIMDSVIRYRKRRRKRVPIITEELVPLSKEDIVSVHSKSYWADMDQLADSQRIDLLHKALGLAS